MSINNINNLPNFENSVNRIGSNVGAGGGDQALNALSTGDIDWGSTSTGSAKLISAQDQFSSDASIDDMVQAVVVAGKFGL